MLGSDLLLGFILAKLFGKGDTATQSPRQASNGHAHARARHGQAAPAAPSAFPSNVDVPTSNTAPAGPDFLQAVEVWGIRPDVAVQTTNPVLTGAIGQISDATALAALEASFPAGWAPVKHVSAAEQATAIGLTKKPPWHDGGLVFMGPETLADRRAYRMVKHPKDQPTSQPAPIPVPSQPGATVPASFPVPVIPSAPPPGFDPSSRAPVPTSSSSSPNAQAIVTVQRGEGLAQIAKRLGQPSTATSAKQLRDANVPNGPDGHTWKATSLTDAATRGIQRTDRKGGLQPGDRLFVPAQWGTL
jgi:hypothetical protein